MFVGRKEEIKVLSSLLDNISVAALIYGKRKVGKTTLLKKVLEGSSDKTIYYECIKSSMKENIEGLTKILYREKVIPTFLMFDSFINLFEYLNTLDIKINIVIDEYPYLKEYEDSVFIDSIFQNIIDNYLCNIRLFISGSHIGMMKSLLNEKNALYGRFKVILNLKELDYVSASLFYKNKEINDKIAFYSVFGGSPYINSAIDKNKTLKQNIQDTILNPMSYVYAYVEHLLLSDFTNSVNAERIFNVISNGSKKYGQIESKLGIKNNGNLSKQLKILEEMDIIKKEYPINKLEDNKKSYYEVKDNLLRFYYTYIYKNKSILQMIGAEAFYEEYIEPSIKTFISHRFEEIVRDYFSLCVKKGKMKGIFNIGSFYYDDSKNKMNGEFDVSIKTKEGYDIYEVKYYSSLMKLSEMKKEIKQIESIKGININRIGFICTGGYEDKIDNCIYINTDELYKI